MPVRVSPSPITNSAAIRITLVSLNPARASGTLMMPVSGRMTITSKATTSILGLLTINSPTQAISAPKTRSRSAFIARRFRSSPASQSPGEHDYGAPPLALRDCCPEQHRFRDKAAAGRQAHQPQAVELKNEHGYRKRSAYAGKLCDPVVA